jgi:hypothetical protein
MTAEDHRLWVTQGEYPSNIEKSRPHSHMAAQIAPHRAPEQLEVRKALKLNSFQMIASSIGALGGLALAAYQVFSPSFAPQKAEPAQVTVDQNGTATTAAKQVTAASSAQVTDAGKLLNNMRASLGLISDSYADEVKKPGAHQSGRLVLASTKETAVALKELDGAIESKDSKKISGSSKNVTRSIGKLQTNYALAATKPKSAETGMKTLNNNWNAYAARYMVQSDRKIAQSPADTKKLRTRVRKLGARVDELEKRTRENEALNREVIRVRERLDYDYDYEDEEDYAGLLITLAFIDGAFEALSVSSQYYYPEYYDDLHYDPNQYHLADAYWGGYYDGYYDGRDNAWYEEDYAVPQVVVLQPDPVIIEYQEVNYTQIINVTNEAAVAYEALPAEELTKAKIEPVANGVVSDAQAIKALATAEPAAAGPEAAATKLDAPASEEPAVEGQLPAADTAATGEPSAQPEASTKTDLNETQAPAAETATGTEAPALDQPAAEEPAAEQPAAAATVEQPAAEEPAAEQPAADSSAEQPAAEEPAAQEPAAPAEEATTEAPPEETAAPAEESAAEAPAEELAPPVEEPAAVAPAEEVAAPAEEPAPEAPAEEQASPPEETAAPGEEQQAEQPANDAAAAQPAAECGGEGNPCPEQQ